MRTSTAFEAIEDPSDPAWHGHAPDPAGDGRWLGRSRVLGFVAVVALVGLGVAGAVLAQGWGNDPRQRSTADASGSANERPSAVVAADVMPDTPVAAPVEPAPVEPTASSGSGWAPAAATVAPEDTGSGLLVGDLTGIHPELIKRLDALAVATGREIEVISGWRTRHEQEGLYQSFLSGVGNLAAVPGTSNHETGRAADVYMGGVALASVDGVAKQAAALGLHFPVPGEAWHVEMVGLSAS